MDSQERLKESKTKLLYVSFCALTSALSFGYTIGFSSPSIPQLEKIGILSRLLSSLFGALLPVGAFIGCLSGGRMIDNYGRKSTLVFLGIPFSIGWLLICHASNVIELMLGRLLTGFASGIMTVSCPIYIAEISTNSMRGTLGSGVQLFITIGILLAYACGKLVSYVKLAELGLLLSIMLSVLMITVPETPRFYLLKNRKKDALLSLAALREGNVDIDEECQDLENGITKTDSASWSELLSKSSLYKPLKIGVVLMIIQQLSGINAVMFFAESIFKASGYSDASQASIIIGFVQVLATLFACYMMDRKGRRYLLVVSGLVMSVSCFLFVIHHIFASFSYSSGWLALVSLVLYIVGYSFGWGPVPALIMAEVFPSQARARGSSLTMVSNWTTGFIVSVTFMSMQDVLSPAGTFTLYGLACVIGVFYVLRKVPETKGKSLEEIEQFFSGSSYPFV